MGRGNHRRAWRIIKKELLGNVIEITRKPNWGFKNDKPAIETVVIDDFLLSPKFSDTILLHILAGEGEDIQKVIRLIDLCYNYCTKLIVLEHNYKSDDWKNDKNVTEDRFLKVQNKINSFDEDVRFIDFDRNVIFCFTTLKPLCIPNISDLYLKKYIDNKGTEKYPCRHKRLYLMTSEQPLDDIEADKLLPHLHKSFYWVIGGKWGVECINKIDSHNNHFLDSSLLQVIFFRYCIENKPDDLFINKMSSLYSVDKLQKLRHETMITWKKWRKIDIPTDFKTRVNTIRHLDLKDLNVSNSVVYVSTVLKKFWKHLENKNVIIQALEPKRDINVIGGKNG